MGLDNPIHLAFLLVILLMVFGAKRLPEMGRSLGSGLRGFKESINGEHATEAVEHASAALFGRGELARLDDATLRAALRETSIAELTAGTPDGIVDLLVASGLAPSKGAARRTIAEGAWTPSAWYSETTG